MRKVLLAFALVPSLAVVSAVPALAKGAPATICSDDGSHVTYVVTKGKKPGTYMATYEDNDGILKFSAGDTITGVAYLGPATSCA